MAAPCTRHLEAVKLHVPLQGLGRTIILPQLKAPLDVPEGSLPFTEDVALKGTPEHRSKLADVLLQVDQVRVQREHVIYALVLERLYVDVLVLSQLDESSNLVVIARHNVNLREGQVESVDTDGILVLSHSDHINLPEGNTSLERHQVVECL